MSPDSNMVTEPEEPKISIVIPTYGRPAYLAETLESIRNQTYPPHEVIVVDDYSPTPVSIPDIPGLRLKTIRHRRNQGAGAARNTGMAHAAGEWIMFLDDDDLLTPIRLELAVRNMGEARAHAVAGSPREADREGRATQSLTI